MSESGSNHAPKPSIILATAVRGGISPHYESAADGLKAWCVDQGIAFGKLRVAEAPIDAARDGLAAGFLASTKPDGQPYSHLVMVDAGVGYDPATIGHLLSADEDFTAVAVPLRGRTEEGKPVFAVRHTRETRETGQVRLTRKGTSAFLEIDGIGAALICIKREVLLRVFEAYPDLRAKSAPTSYFLPAIMNAEGLTHAAILRKALRDVLSEKDEGRRMEIIGRALDMNPDDFERCGEDIAFCLRWRSLHTEEKPARIWLMPDANIMHEGHGYFGGNYAEVELGGRT